jgi:hypothetical protein
VSLIRLPVPLQLLPHGPHLAFTNNSFFIKSRDSFIDESLTFLEVDLSQKQLRFFESGVLIKSTEILSVAEEGSWRKTPAGLYQVERKQEREFSSIGQAYLPWPVVFQSNLVIHGQPVYPSGDLVEKEFKAGGIQVDDAVAEALYRLVPIGTTVLVHEAVEPVEKTFVYEPKVLELKTPHYFVADIKNGTILASSDLDSPAPIASVTKLMTAVVASEKINLDGRIQVTSPTFVTSLIPRLSERSTVSVYSLLQLLLVESSNESAETLAGEFGREEFIDAMNQKARQLGMMNTNFADPSGLSADNTSSVQDLYRLAKYIYKEKKFIFEITAKAEVPNAYIGGEFSDLVNFNEIEGVGNFIGGKVGETLAAGQTSVSLHTMSFEDEQRVLVVILLGSEGRRDDIMTLLNYVETRF